MSGVAGLGVDERRARVVLSLLAEPDDPVTGALLRRLGAVETLGLLDTDTTVPGLGRVDGQVWRDCLTSPDRLDGLDQRLRMVEESGITILIPGDAQWPRALDDLGDRAPYVLFVRGTTSFLARPLNDLVTVTGSRAASAYGEHVADELAGDLANCERVLVAGGAYGVEAAVNRAVLAAGGDTIVVLAGGVDRPYPSGHRDLLDRVGDVGALVSELPPESVPTRHRFLARSRLLGAMSAATVVVEAGARSGGHYVWRPRPISSDGRWGLCRGRSPAPPVMVRTSCSVPAAHRWSPPLPTSKNSSRTAPSIVRGCRPSSYAARLRRLVRRSDLCSPVGRLWGLAPSLWTVRDPASLCPAITGRGAASPGRRGADAHPRWSDGSASVVLFRPGHSRSSAPCCSAGCRAGPGR